MSDLKNLFIKFINKVPSFGKAFICIDDRNNFELLKKIKIKNYYTYGTNSKSQFHIKNIKITKEYSEYDLVTKLPGKKNMTINRIKIPLLGLHNIRNATAAVSVASTIGIPIATIKKGLKDFKGVQRRFNKIFTFRETSFYDDYAHHPTEIKEILNGIRAAYKKDEIICIFQPHRISRLKDLKKEFTQSFKKADTVILCPVYAAGEKIKLGFNYNNFAKEIIKNSKVKLFLIKDKYQLAKLIKQTIYGKKIVVGMGAGTISGWMKELPKLI